MTGAYFIVRLLVAVAFGIFGYIAGVLLGNMGIFPTTLLWENIFLFLGLGFGFFIKEIGTFFGDIFEE